MGSFGMSVWFISLAHARSVIEAWRIEYNTDRTAHSLTSRLMNSQVGEQTTLKHRYSYPRTLTPIQTNSGVRSNRLTAFASADRRRRAV